MKILKAKYILVCDEEFRILEDKAILFDERILKIGNFVRLIENYPDAEIFNCGDCVAMPCFINPHTHLEYSANQTKLIFGDYLKWVNSVIENRSELSEQATQKLITDKITEMMRSGVGTIGEISSFGVDLEPCVKSAARIVYFNEILGTNEKFLDANWANFMGRYKKSAEHASKRFIPAVSVHSPYSTHPKLAKKVTRMARAIKFPISVHFLESRYEKEWLNSASGGFKTWLEKFAPNPKPFYSESSFVQLFKGFKTLFTHCVFADDFSIFDEKNHSITHCAVSNRMLCDKTLDLKALLASGICFNIGTDGLSSNVSLNFFDELRANLLIHTEFELNELAKILLLASTNFAAKSLKISNGEISTGKLADIAVFDGFEVEDKNEVPLWLILRTKAAKFMFIGGELWR